MKLDVFTQTGKKATTKVEVDDTVFGAPINRSLLAQYVHVYLSNQRAAVAHTKDRGVVSGGGRKPWRQKGTGNARAGSIRSPLWKGGGVTFGPLNTRNWRKQLPKRMRTSALRSALSELNAEGKVKVIQALEVSETSQAQELLAKFNAPRKVTIATSGKQENVVRAFANIPSVRVITVEELNAYDVITAGELWILQDALTYFAHWA